MSRAPAMHPPKVETFDLAASVNTDPKGFHRPVDTYRVEPWGLYMARPADHPQFHYLESWLVPSMGIRATIFHFTPGHERDQDRYVDIGQFDPGPSRWTSRDLYLDLVVRTGRDTRLLDVDELLQATAENLVDAATAEEAITVAAAAIDGIAAHDHDLDAWLGSLGMPLSWR
ncbi:DUF402 domain-containing protein [Rhodococcus sp. HNM0569]|uniref:DUF402 domain-containing protein n=1 Tax=Rhodococcus sp. HNM0569 TaxID=2716340 RepID=UPI00146B2A68|nr:DUF402 domain-containing protein [Rhodococcus sp. HNM0569]NLU83044.1 DUF402 domain-containing protein [Rhodococcus sp. HNM0569]